MKLQRIVTAIFDGIITLFGILVVILIAFNMISVSTAVVMRYLLKSSPAWVIEVTEYSLLYITFLGSAWLLRKEGHVRMDLIISGFNPKTRALINTITYALCTIVCFIVAWYGVKVTWDHYQTHYVLPTILRPPSYLIVGVIPIGSFALFVQFLRRTTKYLQTYQGQKRGM